VITIFQGSVVTQTVLGGLTMDQSSKSPISLVYMYRKL